MSAQKVFEALGVELEPEVDETEIDEPEESGGPPALYMGEELMRMVEVAIDEKKKAGQERISKKIGHLIGDEGKSKEQAAAIAYSMEERGELSEDELEEASSMAAGNVQGYSGGGKKKSLIREEEPEVVEEVLNYLLGKMEIL